MQCGRFAFGLGLALALLVGGCGGSGQPATAGAGGEAPAPEAAASDPAAPAEADAVEAEGAQEAPPEVVLPSGLRYHVLAAADGPRPKATDAVTVHYEGRLVDGTVFDSSRERGLPTNFRLDQVIAGWTEALQLMSPGAKWRLTVPPELAYGDQGVGELIGPGATLIFDVELLDFEEGE